MMKNNKIEDHELKSLLENPRIGSKNHYIATCPFCSKTNHFYINRNTQLFDCKKCGEEGNIVKLLSSMGKLFLLGEYKSIERSKITLLSEFKDIEEEVISSLDVQSKKLPIGFKRISDDEYLRSRGLLADDFKRFRIGYTDLVPSLKNYVIFSVDENGESKGYISRYIKPIQKGDKKTLRYKNAKHVNFSHLLFGFDEITKHTEVVVAVEGLFDKISIDNHLCLFKDDTIKSVATFGKKISKFQVLKLQSKGVKKIILIYDYDAIKEMKKYSLILNDYFDVEVGFTFKKDINDSTKDEVFQIFNELKNPMEFNKKVVKML